MIKVGVIGVGHLGKVHAKLWKEVEGAELVGVFDTNQDEAGKLAMELGCKSFTSAESLLDAVDGASIVTPTSFHYQVALEGIDRGKHLFIEKPITTTVVEAKDLVEKARQKQVQIQVGHIERFNPALLAVEPYIKEPKFFESHRLAQFKPRGTDVAVVLDLMIHDIDVILSLVKTDVISVDASGVSVVSDEIDIANARIKFAGGAVANVTASRISQNPMRKLRIFERDAYLSIDFAAKNTEVFRLASSEDASGSNSLQFNLGEIERAERKLNIIYEKPEVKELNPLRYELELFCDVVSDQKAPIVSGYDGLRALEVAESIMTSIEKE